MASIVLDRISKVFRHGRERIEALKDVRLEISKGELLTILGPSGSGKTTLLRLITGLDNPNEGDIRIDGKSMNGIPPHERDVAMVFQSGALFPHMTVHENISVGLKLRKVPRTERENRIKGAVDCLRLQDCLSRTPPDLSTGQRQRVALARAMVRRPAIFLLDEPLANLDVPMRAELRAEIVRLRSRLNATMIYVTHDQAEALSLGDRVAVLRDGKLEQVADPAALYARPVNTFVAQFIGFPPMNLLSGTLLPEGDGLAFVEMANDQTGCRLAFEGSQAKHLQAYATRRVILGVRPEDVAINAGEAADRNATRVAVERVEHTGPDTYAQVRTAGHTLMARASPHSATNLGNNVSIKIQPLAAHLFDPETGLRLNG